MGFRPCMGLRKRGLPTSRGDMLLEVLGRGLGCDLRSVLRRFTWPKALTKGLLEETYRDPSPKDVERQLGLLCWRESRLPEAKEHLGRAVNHDPQAPSIRAALSCVLDELGDGAAALQELRALDRLSPNQAVVQFSLGLCYERIGQPGSALVHYHRAVAGDETFLPACERLAAVALFLGNLDDAIRQYETICRIHPENPRLRTSLGNLLFRAGRYADAVEAFEDAIVLEPENWAIHDEETVRLVAEGHIRQAIDRTHHAIEVQGPFADLFLRLANLHSLVGDDSPAVHYYLQTLDVQPFYMEALVKLATHHLLFGRWEEAAETFGRAAEVNEWVLTNYLGMGVAQASDGRIDQAAESFRLAATVEPNSTLLLSQMIRLHWKLSMAEAIGHRAGPPSSDEISSQEKSVHNELACHAEWVAHDPRSPEAHFHYGVLLRSAGRQSEAARQFARAVRLHPTYLSARIKLGVSLKEQGRESRAARIFHQVFHLDKNQIEFHYRLGVCFLERERMEEMTRKLETSIQGRRNMPDARSWLVLSLATMGLMDRHAVMWRQLRRAHRVKA
jgi:tetratricopeptide (TPR) repeat protein